MDALAPLRARYGDRISAYRREKLARITDEGEQKRGLLAEYCLISALLCVDPTVSLPLAIHAEPLGKPFLIGLPYAISLSHAGEFAAATVGSEPVGVDVERTRHITEALARRICTDAELERLWNRNPTDEGFRDLFSAKEALVKRSGVGIAGLKGADLTQKTNAVRQLRFSDYVLSVASESNCEWEVYQCEKDGTLSLRSFS